MESALGIFVGGEGGALGRPGRSDGWELVSELKVSITLVAARRPPGFSQRIG